MTKRQILKWLRSLRDCFNRMSDMGETYSARAAYMRCSADLSLLLYQEEYDEAKHRRVRHSVRRHVGRAGRRRRVPRHRLLIGGDDVAA